MTEHKIVVRTGQAPPKLSREAFGERFRRHFVDGAFDVEREALARIEAIAWDAYTDGRKAPITRKAGARYADPDYDLSVDWLAARARIDAARARHDDAAGRSRVLLVNASGRNDGTCPGEMSKSFRLATIAQQAFEADGFETDLLDLSLLASEYGRDIHPCKGCASTAMPLCHWPCSCYPNHSLGQVDDWMNEIYERFTAAHAVVFVTPTYWYQSPGGLKVMIDRLVCADGGNPDPTSTHGKDAEAAKRIELDGWDYPKHLAGRIYGLIVHGDVAGIESTRRNLSDWLDWMGLIDAGMQARLDRYIGYYEPYAPSHDTLDADRAVQDEARNVARAVVAATRALRAGRYGAPDADLPRPRPK